MANLAEILTKKYQQCAWTIEADNYNSLVWYPQNTIEKPTEAELRAFDAEVSLELRWDVIKHKRNKLLEYSDWTQLADSPLSSEIKSSWATYRQQLRDIPQQGVEPENVVWPVAP